MAVSTSVLSIVTGLIILVVGARVSVYSVLLAGAGAGLGGAFVAASSAGLEGVALLATVLVGIGIGTGVAYFVFGALFALVGFVGGAYIVTVIGDAIIEADAIVFDELGTVFVGGLCGALAAVLFKHAILVLVTSFTGAALVSLSVTLADLREVTSQQAIDPILFDPLTIPFLGLFVIGITAQSAVALRGE
jgi:hypothetical protein